ncbi:MAG: CPBP family intramembrane metalloprotease [Flavobacteriaceae bacterium]|nr:CPBP family intramembrane metalloprotease [Flavobacteriaceae bacterium]
MKINPSMLKESKIIKFAVILVIARCVLLIISQGITSVLLYLNGDSTPWKNSSAWWTIFGTFTDLICLALIIIFLKKEGKKIYSLIDFDKKLILKDIKTGLIIFVLIFPLFGLLYSIGVGRLLFNEETFNLINGQLAERTLPNWAFFYSILIWWPIWSFTEELTYQGYSLTRLLTRYNKTKVILFIGFFWALQHSFLPLILDWRYITWRFLSFIPIVIGLMFAFIKVKRLTPIIIAHALMDLMAAYWTFKHF